jgi:hypothetical protein
MGVPVFESKELTIVEEVPGFLGGPPAAVYQYPVSSKEGYRALFEKKPIWQITGIESKIFNPKVNPDNVARALVFDNSGMLPMQGGGRDLFQVEWEFIAKVGGSMVRPGKPLLEDANEWTEKIIWPDIDSWDWKESAKINEDYLADDKWIVAWFFNGWFERLVSWMDFPGASIALIDDDQKDAVKSVFSRLTDLYIEILDRYVTYFPQIDSFFVHDDWGAQRDTFFSLDTAKEMIVPYMKRLTDFLHSKGKFCELHSCGSLFKQVPNMIEAGWDSWNGQMMNDTQKIYDLYGDKLLIAVIPDSFDPLTLSEEEQRECARQYAAKFCNPAKPSYYNYYAADLLTPAFREELYKQARILYA